METAVVLFGVVVVNVFVAVVDVVAVVGVFANVVDVPSFVLSLAMSGDGISISSFLLARS